MIVSTFDSYGAIASSLVGSVFGGTLKWQRIARVRIDRYIDDHETVLTFESKEDAEAFAQTERTRLTEKETKAEGVLKARTRVAGARADRQGDRASLS